MVVTCQQGTERLLSIRLITSTGPTNLISAYAPTLNATMQIKDDFYNQMDSLLGLVPKNEHIILL